MQKVVLLPFVLTEKMPGKLDQTALNQYSLEKNAIGLGKDRDNKTLLLYI